MGSSRPSGVITGVCEAVAPLVASAHCSIHRETLAVKKKPVGLKTVLYAAVPAVNFIKSLLLQSRLFSVLREEIGSDHKLLSHTKVRCSPGGRY